MPATICEVRPRVNKNKSSRGNNKPTQSISQRTPSPLMLYYQAQRQQRRGYAKPDADDDWEYVEIIR